MSYTLHQLKVFQKIVEFESVTKAAEALNMTQPAVSIQLRNLQDQFDTAITEVIGRQIYITDFGRELYIIARRVSDEIALIEYRSKAFKGILAGKLRFAVVSTGKYVLPYFLSDFLELNPSIDLDLDVTNKREVIESLEKNEVDFALLSLSPDHLDLEEEMLMSNYLFVVGKKDIAEEVKELPKNIEALPFIFREEGSGTRQLMKNYLDSFSLKPKVRLQLKSNEAVKQAVLAGLGYSLLSLASMQNELKQGQLKIMPFDDFPIQSTWRLVWLRKKKQSPVAKEFVAYIQKNKMDIISNKFGWMDDYL